MVSIRIARVTAVGVMAITAMAGLMAPASAAQASMRAGHTVVRSDAAKPNSNIVGSGKAVNYSPKSLNVKWSGPTEKTCTAKFVSFTITNTTKTSETVTLQGKTFGTLKAGKVGGVCVWGTGKASGKFGLAANKKASLTVHVS